jgi:putative FmdB family regulatory protein
MPIYEYRCEDCGTSFEALVRPGHRGDAQCPRCSGARLSREMSVFAARGADGARAAADAITANGGGTGRMGGGGCCGGGCACH